MNIPIKVLVILLLCHVHLNIAEMMTAYKSTSLLTETNPESGLKLSDPPTNKRIRDYPGLTFCGRFNFKRLLHGGSRAVHIETAAGVQPRHRVFIFLIGYEFSFFAMGNVDATQQSPSWIMQEKGAKDFFMWSTNTWHQFCVSYTKATNWIRLIRDGKETIVDFEDKNVNFDAVPDDWLKFLYVGRCPENNPYACSRHGGEFTDVNIWSRPLSKEEMLDWTSCRSFDKGDVLNWDTAQWSLSNMKQISVDSDILCTGADLGHTLIPGKWDIDDSILLCKWLGGKTSVVKSQEEQRFLTEIYSNHSSCVDYTGFFWSGWWDRPNEGTFTDVNTDEPLEESDYSYWGLGEPNGNRIENCATIRVEGFWNDLTCKERTCSFCELGKSPIYYMRGLCPESYFDIHYGWTGEMLDDGAEKFLFSGYSKSQLVWDSSKKLWKLESYKDPEVFAYLNETGSVPYPFGTHRWTVIGDKCIVGDTPGTRYISFTVCKDDEFNCHDGTCIPLLLRCDGKMQCGDKSDEVDCQKIITDEAYIKSLPPPPTESGTSELVLSSQVNSILNINEVDSLVKFQLSITLSWKDRRLIYNNLNLDTNLNSLTMDEKELIWIPSLTFVNTVTRYHARFDIERSIGTISMIDKDGNVIQGEKSADNINMNTDVYLGKDCPIRVSNFYSQDFICQFDMALYPFDTQRCQATFILKGTDQQLVSLLNGTLEYVGPQNVQEYVIIDIRMGKNKNNNFGLHTTNSVSIEVRLGRQLLSVILTSFVPTIILVVISLSTNFTSDEQFKAVVTVNLTAMLVIVTLFISDAKSLPKTAYMKMIDLWAISTMSIPFFEVIIHTSLDYLRHKKAAAIKKKDQQSVKLKSWVDADNIVHPPMIKELMRASQNDKTIDRCDKYHSAVKMFAKYFLPLIFTIFVVGFFIAGRMALDKEQQEE